MNDRRAIAANMHVRMASEADAPQIAEIYAEHVRTGTASFDTEPRTAAETVAKITTIRGHGWPFLVAEYEHEIIGYAYVTRFRDRPAYGFTCENSIYVKAERVGLGIGAALMQRLMADAASCGFRQMIAVIGGGEPASVALHTKMGFTHAGRMRSVGRKFGRWLDSFYMQAELDDGDRTAPAHEPG